MAKPLWRRRVMLLLITSLEFLKHTVAVYARTRTIPAFLHHHHHRRGSPSFSRADGATTRRRKSFVSSTGSGLEEDEAGNVMIPSAGISVSDEMEDSQKDIFVTEVVPITGLPGIAQLVSTATVRGSFEPVRYLVSLEGAVNKNEPRGDGTEEPTTMTFVMVDVPPFSPLLVTRIKAFMGSLSNTSTLAAILVTSRDAIHYDQAPAVYRMRRSDLEKWTNAFSGMRVVTYRLDTPRDCRDYVTQILDGYGPFAAVDTTNDNEKDGTNVTFIETGRPLTYDEWDHDVAEAVLKSGTPPPDDAIVNGDQVLLDDNVVDGHDVDSSNNYNYTPEAIRAREDGKRILAVYTPGHSFGSLSFVFPQAKVCCSGFTLPVEDTRLDDNNYDNDESGIGIGSDGSTTGPTLDCRGYITTSRAGIVRQMESARALVNHYSDRFEVVLPSRGDPLFVDDCSANERKEVLLDIIQQYERIGQIYENLGITSSAKDDF